MFTVLDAESIAAPGLLAVVDQAFVDHPDVDIIQGGIQLMDPRCEGTWRERVRTRMQRWYAWHNLLEYLRWFSSQMRYQSDKGFMPLGGNTVFLRTDLLTKTGGWPMSLTEDCELGVRATAVHGARTLTFYDPRLATREETPPDLHTLVKQRRRWNIGFIQSFVAGNWRSLPTRRQRLIACWILTMSLFQTVSFAMLPVTLVTAFWIDSPAPLAVAMCIPMIAIALAVALQMLQIHEYSRVFHRRVPWHVYPLFVATFYPYQVVLSYAAAQAVLWYLLGRLGWTRRRTWATTSRRSCVRCWRRRHDDDRQSPVDADPADRHDRRRRAGVAGGHSYRRDLSGYPIRFGDEGTYVSQAWAIPNLGALAHYTYWYDHPPLGWVQMSVYAELTFAWERWSDNTTMVGREFAVVLRMVSTAFLFVLARRAGMRRFSAATAAVLFVLSPLAMHYGRLALLDNIAIPWVLAAFVLAFSPRHRWSASIGLALCFAVAVLSKETLLLLAPALALAIWTNYRRSANRGFVLVSFGLVGFSTVLLYPLYAVTKSELFPGEGHVSLVEAVEWQLHSRTGSGSVFDPDSDAHNLVRSWLKLDPWLPVIGWSRRCRCRSTVDCVR